MRNLVAGVGLCVFLPVFAAGGEVPGSCERTFEANFQPGSELRMRLRSGDIEVVGRDSPMLRVSCVMDHREPAKDVAITFRPDGKSGDLRIRGGPTNGIRFRVEVP